MPFPHDPQTVYKVAAPPFVPSIVKITQMYDSIYKAGRPQYNASRQGRPLILPQVASSEDTTRLKGQHQVASPSASATVFTKAQALHRRCRRTLTLRVQHASRPGRDLMTVKVTPHTRFGKIMVAASRHGSTLCGLSPVHGSLVARVRGEEVDSAQRVCWLGMQDGDVVVFGHD